MKLFFIEVSLCLNIMDFKVKSVENVYNCIVLAVIITVNSFHLRCILC